MVEHLKDDLALQLFAFKLGYIRDLDRKRIDKLAARLEFPMDWDERRPCERRRVNCSTGTRCGPRGLFSRRPGSSPSEHGKKLLVVLFDPYRAMAEMRQSGKRYDQEIVDYLATERFDFFDMNEVHLRDYRRYNLPYEEYLKQYFIGHYNPRGNHFFAYSIKDKVVKWLDPKPITYRQTDPSSVDFKGYLPGGPDSVPGATSGALPRKFRSDGHIGAERAGALACF